ncbi:MAG: glycine zipper 2TM domain-containing protein [Pseudomonadota bacterium]
MFATAFTLVLSASALQPAPPPPPPPASRVRAPKPAPPPPPPPAAVPPRAVPVYRYDARGRYVDPVRLNRGDRVWRGRDGAIYCRRDNGTTGLVIGAALGALTGRMVDTQGDRTAGTLLGALAGGALGREIDRGDLQCR